MNEEPIRGYHGRFVPGHKVIPSRDAQGRFCRKAKPVVNTITEQPLLTEPKQIPQPEPSPQPQPQPEPEQKYVLDEQDIAVLHARWLLRKKRDEY